MIITCNKCHARYRLKKPINATKTVRARCLKCGHVFPVTNLDGNELAESSRTSGISIDGLEEIESERDAKVISVCNQKGGVAKTTTALNLAISLRILKKQVLLVDFDIQSNLTLLMGHKDARSFFDVLQSGESHISNYILKSNQGVWLLPSNCKMALLAKNHLQEENFEYLLREHLESVKRYFDYIIIDTPPSGDFYTLNALLASDLAIIPTPAEYLSMHGVNHIVSMIDLIRDKSKHAISYKIPVTMFDVDNTASRAVLKKLREDYGANMFRTVIEKDQKIQESQIVNKPAIIYDRDSRAGRQYYGLAREVLEL